MNLNQNPIFLTQKRLVHRSGILAAVLLAALVGLSLLAGLISYLVEPQYFSSFQSSRDAGIIFYAWTLGIESLILVFGVFGRIARVLAEERKAGLWDSNRLTPLKPGQLIIGYWFGPALREFYMGVILAATGLAVVLLGRLPFTLWLETQALAFCSAAFLGLLAVLAAIVLQKPQNGIGLLIVIFFSQIASMVVPKFFITNFILPVYAIGTLFVDNVISYNQTPDWAGPPHVFSLPIYPMLLSLGLQLVTGIFLWRMAVRKTANPFQSSFFRWEAIALFAVYVFVQQGLLWGIWCGRFPQGISGFYQETPLLSFAYFGTMILAMAILAASSPQPESMRLNALRLGIRTLGAVFFRSSVSLALILTFVVAAALLTQFLYSPAGSWEIYLIVIGNLLAFCLIFSLLLEYCRLRHKRRGAGFVAVWLFVLCVLPFIFAAVFGNVDFIKFSLISPGFAALVASNDQDWNSLSGSLNLLLGIDFGHLLIAGLFFIGWWNEWKKLLARAA